jgi:transcriptional regulator with XRE-family HTH domain
VRAQGAVIMIGMAHARTHPRTHAGTHADGPPAIGMLLQYWRRTRNLSQLALAHEADVSPRHVCFLETGRARPSREMVLLLADALAVPLRERNALLLAAGFAPMFRESTLDDPELAPVRTAIEAILAKQEPYPAVVMNRHWNIVATNRAAATFFGMLLAGRTLPGPDNVLRLMFHPEGLRPAVENWDLVAHALIHRVHREAVGGALDDTGRQLLSEILDYPGVPSRWRTADLGAALLPVVPVSFRHGDRTFRFFSAVTVVGTPQDITLQELRIECFFPLDQATATASARLLGGRGDRGSSRQRA